ncbi:hypothetical protein C8J57DRAFT_1242023 [Mycena rebaudengoi]|nr:hypothetical protein C8J57DRAFT_1242023 [Mycena rebaudengoi]
MDDDLHVEKLETPTATVSQSCSEIARSRRSAFSQESGSRGGVYPVPIHLVPHRRRSADHSGGSSEAEGLPGCSRAAAAHEERITAAYEERQAACTRSAHVAVYESRTPRCLPGISACVGLAELRQDEHIRQSTVQRESTVPPSSHIVRMQTKRCADTRWVWGAVEGVVVERSVRLDLVHLAAISGAFMPPPLALLLPTPAYGSPWAERRGDRVREKRREHGPDKKEKMGNAA